jgi:hypothetical protein
MHLFLNAACCRRSYALAYLFRSCKLRGCGKTVRLAGRALGTPFRRDAQLPPAMWHDSLSCHEGSCGYARLFSQAPLSLRVLRIAFLTYRALITLQITKRLEPASFASDGQNRCCGWVHTAPFCAVCRTYILGSLRHRWLIGASCKCSSCGKEGASPFFYTLAALFICPFSTLRSSLTPHDHHGWPPCIHPALRNDNRWRYLPLRT